MGHTHRALLQRNQPFPDGVLGEVRDAVHVQSLQDLLAVGLDGLDAHVEACGHLLGVQAFGDELEYFPLPGREFGQAVRSSAWSVVSPRLRYGRTAPAQ